MQIITKFTVDIVKQKCGGVGVSQWRCKTFEFIRLKFDETGRLVMYNLGSW